MNLEKTHAAFSKLGYSPEGVDYMVMEIAKVLAMYSSPAKAAELLEATLPAGDLSRFGENSFRRFLRSIDPKNRPFIDLTPRTTQEMEAMGMDWDEIRSQKELVASPPHDFDILADPGTYEALCSRHFRKSKRDEVDPKSLPTARFISVPMGGKRRK